MSKYDRLINFLILIYTDDKECFCKAYKKLSPKNYSPGTTIGAGVWNLCENDMKEKRREYQRRYKEKRRLQNGK